MPNLHQINMSTATTTHVVAPEHTAAAVGSGALNVLGTPVVVAWLEEATCAALRLDEGLTSVGIEVRIEHTAPSAIGSTITATATTTFNDGRNVDFDVVAVDQSGVEVAAGKVRRVIVNAERFMARVSGMAN